MSQRLDFEGAVVDEQAYLDGTREYTIDAEGPPGTAAPWRLTLSFRWPKESDAPLEEGDLTLADPDGSELYAALRGGTAESAFDEETEAASVRFDLTFEIGSGEGTYAGSSGDARVLGTLLGEEARLTLELALANRQ